MQIFSPFTLRKTFMYTLKVYFFCTKNFLACLILLNLEW